MANNKSAFRSFLCLFCVLILSFVGVSAPSFAQSFLESPSQGSFESGISLIRGWVCEANQVQVSIDGGPLRQTAYGTKRGDTVAVCGDDNNGFGLTFNWNSFSSGIHNLRALADGVEFANVNFVVTTLGVDFLTGVAGEYAIADFPESDNSVTLRWSEPHQNFVLASAVEISDNPPANTPRTFLESPTQGSSESGIGLIRGWVCEASRVEVRIDGGPLRQTAYGTKRGDTVAVCGDDNNGFGLTFNWNAVGNGVHNLSALADGVEFANVNFAVTTLGVDFLTGVSAEKTLPDFPSSGNTTSVRWSEPQQNFTLVSTTATGAKIGTAAAITDLLNPYLVMALGANLSNNLGVQVVKGADGQPTQLSAVTWGDLDQNLFANLLLASNGLPMTYRDSLGFEVRFSNFTQTTVEVRVFDNSGMLLSGPTTLPIDAELLFPLQQLAMAFQNPFQSAEVNQQNLKHVRLATAARAPFSLDPLRLETLWAGGIAAGEVLCTLQPVMAGDNSLVAATGCSSALITGFADLADAGGGNTPEVQNALKFSEDVTEAPCDETSFDGVACLTEAAEDIEERETPIEQTVPGTPIGVSASDGSFSDRVQITWQAVTDATFYEIYRSNTTNSTGTRIGQPNAASYDDTTAELDVVYSYGVKACNNNGCSGLSPYDDGFRTEQTPDSFTLTLNTTGNGVGTVSGGGSYPAGAIVNLSANSEASSTFESWAPSPCAASFTMPEQDLTCTATFTLKSYTVSATAGSGGSISPSSQAVTHGDTTSFTITPDSGFEISSVSGCNGSLSGNTYTTGPITSDCAVSASFSSPFPLTFVGTTTITELVTPEWGQKVPCAPASVEVPAQLVLMADGTYQFMGFIWQRSYDISDEGVCLSVTLTPSDPFDVTLGPYGNGEISWGRAFSSETSSYRVDGTYNSTSLMAQGGGLFEGIQWREGETYSVFMSEVTNASAQKQNQLNFDREKWQAMPTTQTTRAGKIPTVPPPSPVPRKR